MITDSITYLLLSFIITMNAFIYERILKLERDIGYIRGYLGLNGTTQKPLIEVVEIGEKGQVDPKSR